MVLTLILMGYAVCGFSFQIIFFNNMFVTVMFWVLLGYARAFARKLEKDRLHRDTLPDKLIKKIKGKVFKKV